MIAINGHERIKKFLHSRVQLPELPCGLRFCCEVWRGDLGTAYLFLGGLGTAYLSLVGEDGFAFEVYEAGVDFDFWEHATFEFDDGRTVGFYGEVNRTDDG